MKQIKIHNPASSPVGTRGSFPGE